MFNFFGLANNQVEPESLYSETIKKIEELWKLGVTNYKKKEYRQADINFQSVSEKFQDPVSDYAIALFNNMWCVRFYITEKKEIPNAIETFSRGLEFAKKRNSKHYEIMATNFHKMEQVAKNLPVESVDLQLIEYSAVAKELPDLIEKSMQMCDCSGCRCM